MGLRARGATFDPPSLWMPMNCWPEGACLPTKMDQFDSAASFDVLPHKFNCQSFSMELRKLPRPKTESESSPVTICNQAVR